MRLPELPAVVPGVVRHTRRRPLVHRFRYSTYQWLVDVDRLPHRPPLATFAAVYRDALVTLGPRRDLVEATTRIDAAAVSLQRYPNETLLLLSLVSHLPPAPAR